MFFSILFCDLCNAQHPAPTTAPLETDVGRCCCDPLYQPQHHNRTTTGAQSSGPGAGRGERPGQSSQDFPLHDFRFHVYCRLQDHTNTENGQFLRLNIYHDDMNFLVAISLVYCLCQCQCISQVQHCRVIHGTACCCILFMMKDP